MGMKKAERKGHGAECDGGLGAGEIGRGGDLELGIRTRPRPKRTGLWRGKHAEGGMIKRSA